MDIAEPRCAHARPACGVDRRRRPREGQSASSPTGYNGAPSGLEHCLEIGCLREKLEIPSGQRHELCRGLHAEQNAIIQASYGISVQDSTLYVTNQPCIICAKMLINAGVKDIVIAGEYPDKMALSFLKAVKIKVRKIKK